jgi:predicted metal-dependent hydrolase
MSWFKSFRWLVHSFTPIKQNAALDIRVRKTAFQFEEKNPYIWCHVKTVAFILNAVSMILPVGETFFIDSVKYYRHRITDPVLKKQVSAFIAQETYHSRQHDLLNTVLKQRNKKLIWIEKTTYFLLTLTRLLPHRTQLAFTCALEHFTALASNVLLQTQDGFFLACEFRAASQLWVWHAVEEIEHKAVCYDVYQYVAGGVLGYIERCIVMAICSINFSLLIMAGIFLAKIDNKKPTKTITSQSAITPKKAKPMPLWLKRRLVSDIIKPYFNYYRPFYHPWDDDNSALVQYWRDKYEKEYNHYKTKE